MTININENSGSDKNSLMSSGDHWRRKNSKWSSQGVRLFLKLEAVVLQLFIGIGKLLSGYHSQARGLKAVKICYYKSLDKCIESGYMFCCY